MAGCAHPHALTLFSQTVQAVLHLGYQKAHKEGSISSLQPIQHTSSLQRRVRSLASREAV